MFYELSMLAVGNLGRARARLIMTSAGVLVGTTAVILLVAITFGLQRAAEAGIGNSAALTEIQVYPNFGGGFPGGGGGGGGSEQQPEEIPQLTVEAVQSFWQIPGVAAVIPMTNLQGGEIQAGRLQGYSQIIGIDPQLLPFLGVTAAQGTLELGRDQVIIGARVGDYFFDPDAASDDGGFQPSAVNLFETDFRLQLYQYSSGTPTSRRVAVEASALLNPGNSFDYAMFMAIGDVIRWNEWITGTEIERDKFRFDQVLVRATSRETTVAVSEAIREMGYGAGGMGDYINELNQFFTTMRLMLGGVGGVALLVAAFGVANTMTMAILERTKEIGLMKAIGATDRDVLTVFLIEAGLVGLAGGAAGVGLSYVLQNLINQGLASLAAAQGGQQGGVISFLPIDTSNIGGSLFVIPPELAIFALVLATTVGLAAGLYPALRAARLPPVIALKME
jgi:putative ABC transport system permease protein